MRQHDIIIWSNYSDVTRPKKVAKEVKFPYLREIQVGDIFSIWPELECYRYTPQKQMNVRTPSKKRRFGKMVHFRFQPF